MKKEIIITRDNSPTLYVPELNEHYHSIHGAIAESQHVFIKMGLEAAEKQEIKILETGFGTGLNALLTYIFAQENHREIYYETLEAYPVEQHLVKELNYPEVLEKSDVAPIFYQLHQLPWNEVIEIASFFEFQKRNIQFQDYEPSQLFDLIYFDAFAPNKQPELWTEQMFNIMYKSLAPKGFLVTYCSQGAARRAMEAVGFKIEKLPGPPGKREMVRAIKD